MNGVNYGVVNTDNRLGSFRLYDYACEHSGAITNGVKHE
jgi:hypothetical protein